MSTLLTTPTTSNPAHTLALAQQAQPFLAAQNSWLASIPYPLSLLLPTESQEKWVSTENLFLACLRTGAHNQAYILLSTLIARFGKTNDHVLALQGLYQEAVAGDDQKELGEVLAAYDGVLKDDRTIFAVRKRRAALLRSMGRQSEAMEALISIVDDSATDAEAWAELADLYREQGAYEQAIFCLEECLLTTPQAWNMHAKLGEVLYASAQKLESAEQAKPLAEAMRRFCRSIELCDDYLRGYYGLRLATGHLLEVPPPAGGKRNGADGELAPPKLETVKKLHGLATAKLGEIVRRGGSGEKGWDGYSEAELKAAREVMEGDRQKVER
ncbi:Inositol phosphatase SIW14 [Teratosphaeriaceae sp. CCFEE 6253]|nr:Inositol phosphatase SIW14 [Teratosphaeriaceae sp. CCFEE 6253]KAK3074165.1 Inositol phosphatase SIW14 [Teratosphaeriaceae sp. CCFEE 6253]